MIAYVAGPYRGKSKNKIINKLQVIRNILSARKVAKELWRMGIPAICPHMNTALFDSVASDKAFLDGDIEMLQKCAFVALVKGWKTSRGTRDEIIFANHAKIPVYEWDYKRCGFNVSDPIILAKEART